MKTYFINVWNSIDPIYFNFTRLQYVPDGNNFNTIFRVRLTRYKGGSVILSDGTSIQKNDLLLKIHLHNVRMLNELQSVKGEIKRAVYVYHMIKRSLPRLANFVLEHDRNQDIKAVIGITTLYKGADRLGFEVFPIKNKYYRLFKKGTFMPINFLANTLGPQAPVYLFMSKKDLIQKYNL